MGPPALLPMREEDVLRIFIALKNQSPWPGSNPRPLGPVTGTLTTTPPRRRLKGLRKTPKTLGQDSRYPGRDLDLGPPKYKAGVLTTVVSCRLNFVAYLQLSTQINRLKPETPLNNI
jgi:hypothetical protein